MRTHTSGRPLPLLALTCVLILTGSALAAGQGVQRPAPTIEVGTVVPQGKDFRIELNQEQVARLQDAAAKNARRGQPVGKEDLNQVIQKDALRKLRTLFPNGVPEGTTGTSGTARLKITVNVKSIEPLEIVITVEW
jgi:hypothetical protein